MYVVFEITRDRGLSSNKGSYTILRGVKSAFSICSILCLIWYALNFSITELVTMLFLSTFFSIKNLFLLLLLKNFMKKLYLDRTLFTEKHQLKKPNKVLSSWVSSLIFSISSYKVSPRISLGFVFSIFSSINLWKVISDIPGGMFYLSSSKQLSI